MFIFSCLADPPTEKGKAIFNSRCASCHNVNKVIVGPALRDVDKRRTMEWIVNFVRSSQTVIKNGDKQAIALFEEFNKIPMPDHRDLSVEDIANVVDFIKSTAITANTTTPFDKPSDSHPNYMPLTIHDYWFFGTILLLVAVLIGALAMLVKVKAYERSRQV